MRSLCVGTMTAVVLSLGVAGTARADWQYRNRTVIDPATGQTLIVRERVWIPDVVVAAQPAAIVAQPPVAVTPPPVVVTPPPVVVPAPPVVVAPVPLVAPRVVIGIGPGYYGPYYRYPYHHRHR